MRIKIKRNLTDVQFFVHTCDVCLMYPRPDGLFYSSEFDALVLSRHILGDSDEAKKEEQECAEKILQDLNRGRISEKNGQCV